MERINIDIVEIDGKEYCTNILDSRFKQQDVRIMLLTNYQHGRLSFRDNLKIKKYNLKNENTKKFKLFELYCQNSKGKYNLKLGEAEFVAKEANSIIVRPIKILDKDNIRDIFILLDDVKDKEIKNSKNYINYIKNKDKNIDNYIKESGLFNYYYNSLFAFVENNNNNFNITKLSALTFYTIAKDFFEKRNKIVSLPNVFVKNFNAEFDMLLLDTKEKVSYEKKLFFEPQDINAIVELKTRGIFFKKDEFNTEFKKYITFEKMNNSKINNSLKKKIKKQKYIYFCLDETNYSEYYEKSYKILKDVDAIGIFLSITKGKNYYIIPIDQEFNID